MQFRILIVDDEEVIRNSIALYLRQEGRGTTFTILFSSQPEG